MKRKLPLFVLSAVCLSATAASLAACSVHHFEESWSSDNFYHYHACTDGECTEKADKATHVWDNGDVLVPAGCTTEGSTKYKCTVCNYEKTETVDPLNHSWGGWTVTSDNMPSADEGGKATRSCTRTDCTATDTAEIALPPLTSEEYSLTDITATCTEDGTAIYNYENESGKVAFTAEKTALGHKYATSWTTTDENEHWHQCERCGDKKDVGAHSYRLSAKDISDTNYTEVCSCGKEKRNAVNFIALGDNAATDVEQAYYKYTATQTGLLRVQSSAYAAVTLIKGGAVASITPSNQANPIDRYLYVESGEEIYFICATDKAYTITCTAEGTKENPITLNADDDGATEEISLAPNGKVYYKVMGGYAFYLHELTQAGVTVHVFDAEGTTETAEYSKDSAEIVIDASGLVSASGDREEKPEGPDGLIFYFTSETAVTFTVKFDLKYEEGSYNNPIAAELNQSTNVSIKLVTVKLNGRTSQEAQTPYYKFIPAETGWYSFHSETVHAALISAASERYGDGESDANDGAGFMFNVYLNKDTYANGYLFQLTTEEGRYELDYAFKIEKIADPVEMTLGENTTATEAGRFFSLAIGEKGEYEFTVTGLAAGGSLTVTYESGGTRKLQTITSDVKLNMDRGTAYVTASAPCTFKIAKSEVDPYALALGRFGNFTGNQNYTFTVPADGDYTIKLSSAPPSNMSWFFMFDNKTTTDQTTTLTGAKAGEKHILFFNGSPYASLTVTILPASAKTLSLTAETEVTDLAAGSSILVLFVGTAGTEYIITPSDANVTLTGYYTGAAGNKFTADANGNVLLTLANGGGTEVASLTVNVKQVIKAGATKLTAKATYVFTAEQAGDYVISGIKLGKSSGTTNYFMVNGVKVLENTDTDATVSDKTYTIENVNAGDVIIFYSPYTQNAFNLALATE